MTGRQDRPRLQAPDLSPPARPSGGEPTPRTPADDPRFTAAARLETHDAFLRGIQDGRVRVVNPETVPARPPGPEPTRGRSPETSLSTKVPESVMQQLRLRYAETGVTIRNQILLALRRDGLEIAEEDIQDERKRPRR